METREFGARLRELRKQAGLSQRELAGKIGINFTYLSKIESRVMPPPSEKVILRLAEVLNADRDDLMTLAGKIPTDIAQILKNREALQFLRAARTQKKLRAATKKGRISIIKHLVNYKSLSRVGIALTLVAAVAASLWFASPLPVKALDISFPLLPATGTLGNAYTFQIKVNIENTDVLPVQSIDLEIRNAASPGTYTATLTDLPLNTGTKSYTSAETSGGAASVSASTAYGWVYASAYRYGYGYRDPEGWGTHYFGTNFGYGYGYGGYQGVTSITYTVSWTSPPNWPGGTYNIKALVYGNGSKKFSGTSTSFTLSAQVVVEQPLPEPDVTDVSNVITDEGVFTQEVTAESEDGNIELTIGEGTTGLTEDGEPLSEITIVEMEEPPAPPSNSSVIGLTYDLGPDGATFDPPINLCFTYNPNDLPTGVNEEDLVIAIWVDGAWLELPSTVDTVAHTICAQVSHFTTFTALAYTAPAAFTTSTLTISPTEVDIGESVTISVFVTNTGDLTDNYEVTLKIDNVAITTKYVTLAGGASLTVTFTTAKDAAGTYTVNINGLPGTFTVKTPAAAPTAPTPAAFTTSALAISPTEVDTGESITISVLVTNTGDLTGSYEVILKIDNVAVATKDVSLAGGASQTVTFTTAKDVAGTYTININGLPGTFTVKTPATPAPAPTPAKAINWWLIGGIIAGVIVIGVIIRLVVRRRTA